jgi:hypothetical protein
MTAIPETYFSRRMRESQLAMLTASDAGSRLAHSQLEAAYRILAQEAEPLPHSPSFGHGVARTPAYRVASVTTADREPNEDEV